MGSVSKTTTQLNQELCTLIAARIDSRGYTQESLSEASGIPMGTIGKLVTGRAVVYVEQLIMLADPLGLDLPALIADLEDRYGGRGLLSDRLAD